MTSNKSLLIEYNKFIPNVDSINVDGSLDITDSAGDPIPVRAKNFLIQSFKKVL